VVLGCLDKGALLVLELEDIMVEVMHIKVVMELVVVEVE
jgi:hypothetical protein